ncbi:phosphate acetyltransferase [Allopusillimonas ginsengisoli]|uniref:phosphate acetyltransferase n=1 Tax=Allopusillimonas ginsengisoli TaxID=453575 RepID=UPI0039C005C4
MSILDSIVARARKHASHIVLCEGQDPRIQQAAARIVAEGIARISLVGDARAIAECASQGNVNLDNVQIIDPQSSSLIPQFAETLYQLRAAKGMTREQALQAVFDPLCFANLMVHSGLADGSVAGAVHTTANVVRTALQIIGKAPETRTVSSFFLMLFDKPWHPCPGGMIFSDCGLVIDPDEEQLADIALAAAESARHLLGEEPRIAMLSFSTAGSASHPLVDKVINASKRVQQARPDILIDEDLQLDAALRPEITLRKLPASKVQGRANVLVFPDLSAGNIGYKLVEHIGGAVAIGPLLQGLNRPANDLSRSCSANDIYYVIAVTALQSASNNQPP